MTDYRAAFELHDYPVSGAVSGEMHLYGKYEEPFGFGRMVIDRGVAYDEPFATGVASLRFEGAGVRLDGLEIQKAGTTITGAAYVGWDGTYSFNADGRRLAVDALDLTYFPGAAGAHRLRRLQRRRQRHLRGAALRRQGQRLRPVLRRRRHRPDDGAGGAARPHGALQLRRRLAAPRGLGQRPVRTDRGRRDRDDRAAVRHVARSVRARVRADAVALHHGDRRRQRAGVGRGLHARRAARRVVDRRSAGAAVRLRARATGACCASRLDGQIVHVDAFVARRGPHGARCQRAASTSTATS